MTVKKYELTDDTMEIEGRVLHRIRALVDIPAIGVSAGDLGGYIESERNLSHEGHCWVGMDAIVKDYASVRDDALVSGDAFVGGHATVRGYTAVKDKAFVSGHTNVHGSAVVRGNARLIGRTFVGGHTVMSGCAVKDAYRSPA